MPEDKYTEVQEVFDSRNHVREHDRRGGEFLHVEKIYFDPSKSSEGDDALMTFQFRGLSKLRAVKISADKRDKLSERIEAYRSYHT